MRRERHIIKLVERLCSAAKGNFYLVLTFSRELEVPCPGAAGQKGGKYVKIGICIWNCISNCICICWFYLVSTFCR